MAVISKVMNDAVVGCSVVVVVVTVIVIVVVTASVVLMTVVSGGCGDSSGYGVCVLVV